MYLPLKKFNLSPRSLDFLPREAQGHGLLHSSQHYILNIFSSFCHRVGATMPLPEYIQTNTFIYVHTMSQIRCRNGAYYEACSAHSLYPEIYSASWMVAGHSIRRRYHFVTNIKRFLGTFWKAKVHLSLLTLNIPTPIVNVEVSWNPLLYLPPFPKCPSHPLPKHGPPHSTKQTYLLSEQLTDLSLAEESNKVRINCSMNYLLKAHI